MKDTVWDGIFHPILQSRNKEHYSSEKGDLSSSESGVESCPYSGLPLGLGLNGSAPEIT